MNVVEPISLCVSQDLARKTEPRPPQDSGSAATILLVFLEGNNTVVFYE